MSHLRRYFLGLLFALFTAIPLLVIILTDKESLDLRVVEGGDFVLQTSQGTLTKNDLDGKTVLIFFGYMSCPDYCPMMMATISAAFNELSNQELAKTRALFISVDPNRDTPVMLEHYTQYFHPNIIGATSSQTTVNDIAKRYSANYKINDTGNSDYYTVDHSVDALLMTKSGEIATKIKHGTSVAEMTKIIKNYL